MKCEVCCVACEVWNLERVACVWIVKCEVESVTCEV